jgi:hypothetical protein
MIEFSRSKKTQLPDAPNGRKRYAINASLNVLQMREDGGVWEDIDPSLDKKGLPIKVPYELTPYLTGLPGFHFKSKNSGEYDVRIKEARTDSISITPIEHDPSVKPVIKGNTITWVDLYPDVDIILTAFNTGVSLNRIIKSPSAPLEYDVDIVEAEKGDAKLMPIKPATDAEGQSIKMEEKPCVGGRTETLKLEVISENPQPIVYPIKDGTIIDVGVGQQSDDGWEYEATIGVDINDAYLRLQSNTSEWGRYWSGWRWEAAIPQGSTIDTCYMNIRVYSSNDDVDGFLHFQYAASPATITTDNGNITNRTRTSSCIAWDADGLAAGGDAWVNSPSIITPLQEVVDDFTTEYIFVIGRPNTVEILYLKTYSWDYDTHQYSPEIYIEYTEGGGGWGGEFCGVAVEEFDGVVPEEIDGV